LQNLTPTIGGAPLRLGDFETLCGALDYAAQGLSGLNFYTASGELYEALSYRELRERAMNMAGRLAAFAPAGARIGLVAETSPDFAVMFYACQYAGLLPAPLSLPAAFGGRDIYEGQIRRMARTAGFTAVMAPRGLIEMIGTALGANSTPVMPMDGEGLPETGAELRPHGPSDLCYIQFSSGSTSAPKGVLGSQSSVTANCRAIVEHGLEVVEGDRAVSWLPLYHDMGLIGFFIAPMMAQLSVDYISPSDFARRPATWLKLISDNRGTLSYSPSFGYDLCARRWRNGQELDLSCWRAAGIGGDMVREDALDAFTAAFAAHGFRAEAFVPSYGLAEATLAVSFNRLGAGVMADRLDTARMRVSRRAVPASDMTRPDEARTFVACGEVLPGHDIRICDDDGSLLGERSVGRILVRGPSVTPGYFVAGEPVRVAVDEDGWLDTGDLGYWLGGNLVVTGRSKDLILYNGRNIWPQDIEWIAEEAGGSHVARCAAFDVGEDRGATQIVLLAECRARRDEERKELAAQLASAARSAAGVPVNVHLVPLRSLVMTSSGKLSRAGSKQKFESGGFLARKEPAPAPAAACPASL